ncbi:protein BIIDXI isoform X2 [Oryza sativa Japonica Group]|uniref:protein BIIDXI isoform X2 n=1 Tax=Oryza sativa subsp. japonica TaxID=39947 RepID=UPI0007753ABE
MEGDTARRLALLGLCLGLLLLAPSHLASAAAVEDGLLSNGDFETAPAGGFVKSASVAEGASSIPGWTINGTVELISAGQHQGGMILIVPQGDHAVRLGNDASIGQVVQVEKGSEYAITFSAA